MTEELFSEGRMGGGARGAETLRLDTDSMDWQSSGHDGFLVKALSAAPGGLPFTQLMKVEPGAFSDLHAHEEDEEVYVLSGSFYDQEGSYGTGHYLYRPAGAAHTAGSEEGAVLLLVYSAPAGGATK